MHALCPSSRLRKGSAAAAACAYLERSAGQVRNEVPAAAEGAAANRHCVSLQSRAVGAAEPAERLVGGGRGHACKRPLLRINCSVPLLTDPFSKSGKATTADETKSTIGGSSDHGGRGRCRPILRITGHAHVGSYALHVIALCLFTVMRLSRPLGVILILFSTFPNAGNWPSDKSELPKLMACLQALAQTKVAEKVHCNMFSPCDVITATTRCWLCLIYHAH